MSATTTMTRVRRRRRGFSLAELILAIAILGIGMIAIAALFPAGIAQQQQSVDDIIGPIVGESALAVLRTKLRPDDFGTFEEFGTSPPLATIEGDWGWQRPAFIFPNGNYVLGAIDVFNGTGQATAVEPAGIPYNSALYGLPPAAPPAIIFSQLERYYPMQSAGSTSGYQRNPEYVWDCMFRRFQGRILVAIFVYRVSIVGGGDVRYSAPANGTVPPLPIHIDLTLAGNLPWNGHPWDADGVPGSPQLEPAVMIPNTEGGTPYEPPGAGSDPSWQAPGQWLLDQNNNVHRVLAGRRRSADGPVELLRPIPVLPPLDTYFMDRSGGVRVGVDNVVTNFWYIPTEVAIDVDGIGSGDLPVRLFPVYATVREL